jgi:UV DNA damage endonuclease
MRKKTFEEKGLSYVSEIAVQNTRDLVRIIEWNSMNDIKVFRISSDLFPWASEYRWESLPDFKEILDNMKVAGDVAMSSGQRLSLHPGQFNCLCSPRENVVLNSIRDLEIHGDMMDMLGQPRTRSAPINIHLGGAYGDHKTAAETWMKNFARLPESVASRLTIENDDKPNVFSTKMLYEMVYSKVGVPIVFDSHHFECGPQDSTYSEAFEMAFSTWPDGIKPMCHHSNSRKIYEDPSCVASSHSDFYYKRFDSCGKKVDVELECKMKEVGLFDYLKKFEIESV